MRRRSFSTCGVEAPLQAFCRADTFVAPSGNCCWLLHHLSPPPAAVMRSHAILISMALLFSASFFHSWGLAVAEGWHRHGRRDGVRSKDRVIFCFLDCCGLPAEGYKRFCSKRHYHAAKHKQSKTSSNKSTGMISCVTLANESVPVAVFEFGFGIFLNFDKIIGFFYFLAFAYTLGKRAGCREVHGLMATTEPVETAEEETQAPPTPQTRAVSDCQGFTAAEISFLLGEGSEVWSDDTMSRSGEISSLKCPPATEDYLPQSEIDKLMA